MTKINRRLSKVGLSLCSALLLSGAAGSARASSLLSELSSRAGSAPGCPRKQECAAERKADLREPAIDLRHLILLACPDGFGPSSIPRGIKSFYGLTTISPAMSSCPLPQKTVQWKRKVPAFAGTMRM